MGKRHDYALKDLPIQKTYPAHPVKLLLPAPQGYEYANIDTLIFLSIEESDTLHTGEDIAKHILKITNGQKQFRQPYISKRITAMNTTGIIARDKYWLIRKVNGRYSLVDIEEEEKIERAADLKGIPFDRSTYFRNDPNRGSIFGFRLRLTPEEVRERIDSIRLFFNKITYNHVFQVIAQDNVVYVLLDTSSKLYWEAVKKLNYFLENEFHTKK